MEMLLDQEVFDSILKEILGSLPITDLKMTRFLISLKECTEFVWLAFKKMVEVKYL